MVPGKASGWAARAHGTKLGAASDDERPKGRKARAKGRRPSEASKTRNHCTSAFAGQCEFATSKLLLAELLRDSASLAEAVAKAWQALCTTDCSLKRFGTLG